MVPPPPSSSHIAFGCVSWFISTVVSGGSTVGEAYPSTINLSTPREGLADKQQCTGDDLFRTNTNTISENSAQSLIQTELQVQEKQKTASFKPRVDWR